jgi:hypothetical protein
MRERPHVTVEERLLGLGGERGVERPARVRQPHHEHPALHRDPVEHRVELPEVDLGLSTGQMRLRDHHLDPGQPQLAAPPRDIAAHRHLRTRRTVLSDQPLPDPPRGVALLARGVPIGHQPAVDDRDPRLDRRTWPRRVRLPRRRDGADQRLAHRPPVDLMALSELPDRHTLHPTLAPDLLEQLHPRPHPDRPPAPTTSTPTI